MLVPLLLGGPELAEAADSPPRCVAAAAVGRAVVIARCNSDGQHLDLFRLVGGDTDPLPVASIEVVEASKEVASGHTVVTALAWLSRESSKECLLCVGFSHGGISLFTAQGAPRLTFLLCPSPVTRVRLGPIPVAGEPWKAWVLHAEGGPLAAFVLDDSLWQSLDKGGGPECDCLAAGGFKHELYELGGREATSDICIMDRCEPLEDVFETRSSLGIVALGAKPFLSQHLVSVDSGRIRKLINQSASVVMSYAKAALLPFWRGRDVGETSSKADFDPLAAFPRLPSAGLLCAADIRVPTFKPEQLAPCARFIDPTRIGKCLQSAPLPPQENQSSGRNEGDEDDSGGSAQDQMRMAPALAATCDAYGRVGLFCLETLRCLHLWKGYRDAQVAWIREPICSGCVTDDPWLGLVIYAPRRGLLELWDVGEPSGIPVRADAESVALDCWLLTCLGAPHLLRPCGRLDRICWRRTPRQSEQGAIPRTLSSEPSEAFDSADSEGASMEDG